MGLGSGGKVVEGGRDEWMMEVSEMVRKKGKRKRLADKRERQQPMREPHPRFGLELA